MDDAQKELEPRGLRAWFQQRATLDAGPFRLLHVAAGLVGILAVLNFLPFIDPFFLPPYPTQYHCSWNVFALVEHPVWTYIFFAAAFGAGVGLILGRRTRSCALVLLIFMSGVISSARPLTSSSASVFCLLMFFLMLMPERDENGKYRGWAIFGLRLQVFFIYFCGILFKMVDPAWQQGFPLAGTLAGFSWASHFGVWVSQWLPVSVLNVFGQGVSGIEVVAPVAMFLLYRFLLLRRASVIALTLMHLGMALLMTLEIFPWVMVAILVVFWDEGLVDMLKATGQKIRRIGRKRVLESLAASSTVLIVLVATGQVFLPALGVEVPWADRSVSQLNRQFRFDQHWGMFTNTSFKLDEEKRARPDKTYKATRLYVKLEDGSFWDPFIGRLVTLKSGLLSGSSHPHSSRKAVSYFYKTSGQWQERGLRAMARWANAQAVQAGQSPAEIVIFRYSIPLDFSKSVSLEDIETVRVKLWYRIFLDGDQLSKMEKIDPRSIRAVRISFSDS